MGSAPLADLRIADPGVAERHAEIRVVEDGLEVRDLGTATGTRVEGRAVECGSVAPGEEVRFGETRLLCCRTGEARASPRSPPSRDAGAGREIRKTIPDDPRELTRSLGSGIGSSRDLERVACLSALSQVLFEPEPRPGALDEVLDVLGSRLPFERACVLLAREDGELELVARHGPVERTADGWDVSESVAREAVTSGQGILTMDARVDQRFRRSESVRLHDIRAVLAVPIAHGEERIGALYADTMRVRGAFDELDLDLMGLAARLIAIATIKRRGEDALRRTEDHLRHAQKMEAVGLLAGGVAHDFNNFLTVILGHAEVAADLLPETSPARASVDLVHRTATKASALTRQLLAVSRKQTFHTRVLDLNRVVGDLEPMLRTLGDDHELVLDLAEPLGPVEVDPAQVEQILLNLAVNARDAMPTGGTLTIRTLDRVVRQESLLAHDRIAPGRYSVLVVSDTGPGIAPEHLHRIFEPFFTTKRKDKGTGLGLSAVYGIVQQSGGTISVDDAGPGATFRIAFPRSERPIEEPTAEPTSRPARGGDGERILVVEDEEDVRTILARTLRVGGYEVLESGSGAEALALCERRGAELDLVVTDVVMPEMNGRELAERLAERNPDLRMLFVSGYTDDVLRDHGVREGTVDLVQKPFGSDVLLRKVREILDR